MAQVYRDIYPPHVYEDCILNSAAQRKLENVFRDFRDDRRGGVLLVFAFFVMAAAGLAALAIDGGYLYSLKTKIQATADAAALSGAAELPDTDEETPDPDAMRTEAVRMAAVNMLAAEHGTALTDGDVTTGNWDGGTRVFTPGGSPINAIRVVVRRSGGNDNAAGLFFAPMFGFDAVDLAESAIAVKILPDDCLTDGMVAGNKILAASNEQVLGAFCMYGRNGVTVGSNNTFVADSQVGMLDLDDLVEGSDNDGLDDALVEMDLAPSEATDVTSLIAGIPADLPDYITQTEFVSVLPDPPVAGTAYIVDQPVDIVSWTTLSDVVIVSTGKITIGSNSSLANVILAAGDNVEMGSYNTIGDSGYCAGTGDGSVQILAANHVKVGSNTAFTGVQIIAGLDADLGSDEISSTALAIQAGNDIKLGSDVNLGVCANGPEEHRRFTEPKTVLVR